MSRGAWIVAGMLALLACSSAKRPRAEPAPSVTPAPAAAPAQAPAAPAAPVEELDPTPEELPLPEDFVAEAAHQITAANFRAQLAAIEKEINADK